MNIYYQDLDLAISKIENKYTKNPRKSASATFRFLRKQNSFSFFGDYPIIATIFRTILILNIVPSRYQAIYTLNQSEELRKFSKRDKNSLLNQLFYPLYVQTKLTKNSLRTIKN